MTLAVAFRKPAFAELEEAALWYESQRFSLGQQFEAEVTKALEAAKERPQRFPRMYKEIRCVRVGRFPYSIFFTIEPTRIVVLSVFHVRRHPQIWQSRT